MGSKNGKKQLPVSIDIKGKQTNLSADGEQVRAWPQAPFGIPNKFLRSALFGIQREKKDETNLNNIQITTLHKNISIIYSGPILNQDDSLIWQIIARMVYQSSNQMGNLVEIPRKDILTLLGKTDGGANFTWLKKCLDRLSKAHIIIENDSFVVNTNLLIGYYFNKTENKVYAGISSLLYPLFSQDLTDIDVIRKTKLKTQLSKWLHDFYSSHSEPIPYSLSRLKELSRTTIQNSKFKKMVEESLNELKQCEPAIITENSYIDYMSDRLIIEKANNSPGVSPNYIPFSQDQYNNYTKVTKNSKKRTNSDNVSKTYTRSVDLVL